MYSSVIILVEFKVIKAIGKDEQPFPESPGDGLVGGRKDPGRFPTEFT